MPVPLPTGGRPELLLCRSLLDAISSHSPALEYGVVFGEGVAPVKVTPAFGVALIGVSPSRTMSFSGNGSAAPAKPLAFGILLLTAWRTFSVWHPVMPLDPLLSALGASQSWPAARWGSSFWWGAAISAAASIGPGHGPQSAPYRRLCIHVLTRRRFHSFPQIDLWLLPWPPVHAAVLPSTGCL
jgi:hypothetical protein